jgi:ABC-2 type transport system permease protein
MGTIWPIFKREFKGYFRSPIAYIFISVFLIISGWVFFQTFFVLDYASMRNYFDILPLLFLFFVPLVTMRMWAEERKIGTMEVLMTLPVRDHEAVLGKYLAGVAFLAVTLALTLPIPLTTIILGDPDMGVILSGYVGALLMGAAYLAMGIFVSSLTSSQIVAAIIGWLLCLIFYFIGNDFVTFNAPRFLVPICEYLGLGNHFDSIGRGVLDLRDLVYYLSVIVFFLFLNVRVIETRKA